MTAEGQALVMLPQQCFASGAKCSLPIERDLPVNRSQAELLEQRIDQFHRELARAIFPPQIVYAFEQLDPQKVLNEDSLIGQFFRTKESQGLEAAKAELPRKYVKRLFRQLDLRTEGWDWRERMIRGVADLLPEELQQEFAILDRRGRDLLWLSEHLLSAPAERFSAALAKFKAAAEKEPKKARTA